MGIQTMGSQSNGQQQQSHASQPSHLSSQNSWYSFTMHEIQNQLEGRLQKPLGSMNLDELLKSVWITEANHSMGMDYSNEGASSASSVQREASMTLARALSGKTVDQVWKEIQLGQRKRFGGGQQQDREPELGDVTLEDFLIQAGLFAEVSVSPSMDLVMIEAETPQSRTFFAAGPTRGSSSPLPSPGGMPSDASMGSGGRKRVAPPDAIEKSIERRLKRKIKNRESAARSRARKQAYCNELESKVSGLQEQNLKLKKEKEFEEKFACSLTAENRYQLRRTSSASDLSSLGVL
ncbi:unnamed protein product [Linum tenue]|uniref:BZIP domain-containing protein n=1 Tax=Linum tenue TaxID=586396 RepID=A0AAV0IMY0_9ROSI|nr:unnamed protein product [Linum tenue]